MSISDAPAYATAGDVQSVLQEDDLSIGSGPLDSDFIDEAIRSASKWLRNATGGHWYDSGGSTTLDNTAATATDIRMSIPSSPHPQSGQLYQVGESTHRQRSYPVTQTGAYARATTTGGKARLPYRFVESIDALEVTDLGGDVTDWVADADKIEGRGEDYYLKVDGADKQGRSYLYLHAGSLGGQRDFEDILTVDVSYGKDWQDDPWQDVRRGVAHLAAAELVQDDDVLTAIPNDAVITSVDTEVDLHLQRAFESPGYLDAYVGVEMA